MPYSKFLLGIKIS